MSNITNYIAAARAARIARAAQPEVEGLGLMAKVVNHTVLAAAKAETAVVEAASNYLDIRETLKAERLAKGCRW